MRSVASLLAVVFAISSPASGYSQERKLLARDRVSQASGRQAPVQPAVNLRTPTCNRPECLRVVIDSIGLNKALEYEHLPTGVRASVRGTFCNCRREECLSLSWDDTNPAPNEWGLLLETRRQDVLNNLKAVVSRQQQAGEGLPVWVIRWGIADTNSAWFSSPLVLSTTRLVNGNGVVQCRS
jgi:hypothetical protein